MGTGWLDGPHWGRIAVLFAALAACNSNLPGEDTDGGSAGGDSGAPGLDGGDSPDSGTPIDYNELTFAGLESIDSVGGDSLRLHWTNLEAADGYRISQVYPSGGTKTLLEVAAAKSSMTLFGLEPQTVYTLRVNALDDMQRIDRNEVDLTQKTGSAPLPNTFGGLFAHYSAGNESAADGATVATWTDVSGNDRHATQSTASQRPTFVADALGGRPALLFDGVDDLLASSTAPTNNFTAIALATASGPHEIDPEGNTGIYGTAGQKYLFGASHGGATGAGVGVSIGENGLSAYEHGSSYMPAVAVYSGAISGWNFVTLTYSADRASLYLNGTLLREGVVSPRADADAPSQFGGGSYGSINGSIAEVLIYSGVLSEADRAELRAYLADWYSL